MAPLTNAEDWCWATANCFKERLIIMVQSTFLAMEFATSHKNAISHTHRWKAVCNLAENRPITNNYSKCPKRWVWSNHIFKKHRSFLCKSPLNWLYWPMLLRPSIKQTDKPRACQFLSQLAELFFQYMTNLHYQLCWTFMKN